MCKRYEYVGAVCVFGRTVTDRWRASTYAPSEAKAISNLKYRFRTNMGLATHVPIKMDGKITTS